MEHTDTAEPSRRDFLYIATGAVGAVGAGALAWPFIHQMNPDASALALASIEVDVSAVEVGQSITVTWRGKPVFIRQRTEKEIAEATEVPIADLPDQFARNANLEDGADASDANRATTGKEAWLVMVGVCTHLGCVPLGEAGEYGGWFCPCHGSHYDTAGRIRKGPAPENMLVPPYKFSSDDVVVIG
ncbi:Ubiquinol-cytochrome c reductase iron-sulfur subunit [Pseudovibrio sp. W64]|uniref:ubiquinol-cytochrome c reductase iron-sulfur subunit n=1 Tax=unclassified Pseudovibrio TaxID=2627060 RepID=UPI00070E25A9|nr:MULTISPECIES: ubiquinol-cytochrome c reductase iron-sulfur subunit [unclassified Pseudovibrio]KZK77165.1 Ubiquinol-cytochrome c reductase iron-sulfur subunit [Pseudovibrio sp. Ad46]KZK80587.1 Ubiquinol-cytochrome c reductase iron-sulfur subunit [Pseudovibrio sp. Ad13]KZK86829.1 Ubiquinol-cytochrome c reductase iron-sulfur subunit [Pseudovibrio sp. W64]KZK89658.1 Ubiquinol-cytochrome c reductase iron-sulfur subunit [Pseudovibrio sp. Ad5]KZL03134.1 Ubiquinol-cytochrome c reductase iron-sulfur